eukprot:TRINITY_DN1567_c1_g2_i3.p1 TRINITY_DN1567_c1_g2~~TRINITY_DN1567_c1_g2_i3.p1  ORF type:complete len:656 (+),score=146.79 TRINITY_DN1567_c1_g2_i3:253-1968(+)
MGVTMFAFYLVNHWDKEFRMYSWMIISQTISIFCAVLLFQSIQGVLKEVFNLEEAGIGMIMLVGFGHFFFWFGFTQFALALTSGAVDFSGSRKEEEARQRALLHPPEVHELERQLRAHAKEALEREEGVRHEFDEPLPGLLHYIHTTAREAHGPLPNTEPLLPKAKVHMKQIADDAEDEFKARKVNVKCFAVLCGHITGFAGIYLWAELQTHVGKHTKLYSFAVVPVSFLFMLCLYRVSDWIRLKVAYGDDQKEDENEKLWDEQTEETEDDVVALVCSFVGTQFIRYLLTGDLPNAEGEDPEGVKHTSLQALNLLLVCMIFLVCVILKSAVYPNSGRLTTALQLVGNMNFAWGLYFAVTWVCQNFVGMNLRSQVTIATIVTFLCFSLIFLIDKIADRSSSANVNRALRAVVMPLATLVGFGWEKSFDKAVEVIVEGLEFKPPYVADLILAVCLCGIVVPAWWKFILPTIVAIDEELEEEKEKEEEGEEHERDEERGNEKSKEELHMSDAQAKRELKESIKRLQKQFAVSSATTTKKALVKEQHKYKASQLERRKRELEATISGISKELRAR